MLIGCYYRCPVIMEDIDNQYPRLFILAQVVEYNELAEAARVKIHDLLGSGAFYHDVLRQEIYRADSIVHCEAIVGSMVRGSFGAGTIIAKVVDDSENEAPFYYWIKLPNGSIKRACETDLEIEYSQMDYSPENQLKSYEFQHPTWFINHLKVSRNCHLINNATYGFKVLAGCRAFLLPHQISTVARCFETLPVRYMLADEVGLGKTVEACSVLSILKSENNHLRCLIMAPGALVGQWENELRYKYGFSSRRNDASADICIVSMEEIVKHKTLLMAHWDIAIIDETHRLLSNALFYEQAERISRSVEHILLLSATPIQDRNEEYRKLLALLNPELYGSMSSDQFALLVKKQKRIQKSVNQQLERLSRFDEYSELIIDKLRDISESLDDNALKKLVQGIDTNSEDNGLESVKQVLAYICEFYRLERKVVRNRRLLIGEPLPKRVLREVPYKPLSADENYNELSVIQSTFSFLEENGTDDIDFVVKTAIPLLQALFSSPWAYEDALNRLAIADDILRSEASIWKKQAQREHELVDIALDEDPDLIQGRLMAAINFIDQETAIVDSYKCKIVVFTANNMTLNAFVDLFNTRYSRFGISAVAFGRHMSRDALEQSVYAFQNDDNCRAIVCDETGGEGRNFQNAEMVIHLDLPWNANDLEQRIGRLDRLGREPDRDVLSVVLYAEGTVEEQLFHIWRDGMKLFSQSLSGLEIITGELNSLIVEALLDDYEFGLEKALDDIIDQADEMRECVSDEQDFDLGATLYRPLSIGVKNVLDSYAADNDSIFAEAMMGWAGQAGLMPEKNKAKNLIEFRESSFSVNAAKQSFFIPPDWTRYLDTSILRWEGRILGSFNRKTAALREDILFFAPGDAVYDTIISNAVGCNRGRCSAIKTRGNFNYDGLVFIFNVEPNLDEILTIKGGMQALAQYRMYLPVEQIIIPIPLTNSSKEIDEQDVIDTLLSITWRNAEHLGKRHGKQLVSSPLEKFIAKTPPEKWETIVSKCAIRANKKAQSLIRENSDLNAAKAEMLRIIHGYRAEAIYFDRDFGSVEEKKTVFNAVLKALSSAKPKLDAACYLKVMEELKNEK